MRERITTLLELAGLGCLSVSAWTLNVTVGLAVSGAALVAAGFFEGRK